MPASTSNRKSGYAKGEATRQAILDAAIICFGQAPFDAVTTRQIADAAGVNLPAIKYYFGGKEGLYTACARSLVEAVKASVSPSVLTAPAGAKDAKAELKSVMLVLLALATDGAHARARTGYYLEVLQREGPAQDILLKELWAPGIEYVAALIARTQNRKKITEADRIDSINLLSSLTGYTLGRNVSGHVLGWQTFGPKEVSAVYDSLCRHIDRLGG